MAEKAGKRKLAATAGIRGIVEVAGVEESGSDILAASDGRRRKARRRFPGSPM